MAEAEQKLSNLDKDLIFLLSPKGVTIEGIPTRLQENPELLKPPSLITKVYRKLPDIVIWGSAFSGALALGLSASNAEIKPVGDPTVDFVLKTATVGAATLVGEVFSGLGSLSVMVMGVGFLDASNNILEKVKKINSFII